MTIVTGKKITVADVAAAQAASATGTTTKTKKASAAATTSAVDAMDKSQKPKPLTAAASAAPVSTLPGIAESFPIGDLSAIIGKGKVGDKFMLDGGSLQGLELHIRRVKDGDTLGFEMFFKVTQARLPELMEQVKKAGASTGAMVYRATEVDTDGIVKYAGATTSISASGTHCPTDTDKNASAWVHKVSGDNGSSIEVLDPKAAKAIRGLVRVQLRGTDAECTKQLQSFVKQLGMEAMLAPPTEKTKERLMLMRCLWQHDHKAAEELSKNGLDNVKVEDLREKLKALGFSDERLGALSWREVFPGHFTAIDPAQQEAMQNAGARYLYSTVNDPAHVLSILRNGQQASMRRFQEGLIVTGMSSNTDFSSGGAVGVFTRLVTQDSIWNGQGWMGRTYKVILKPEILARTDWFGWNGDFYGRSWELDSKINFGTDLVARIDNMSSYGGYGTYASSNELIFRTGNSPEYIAHIVATTPAARDTLIKLLKDEGYTPPGGMSIEDLVRLEPKFFQFGEPELKLDDPEQFIASAFEQAKAGGMMGLRRVLQGAPFSQEQRAKVEAQMLSSLDQKQRDAAMKAVAANGGFAMQAAELEQLVVSLSTSADPGLKQTAETLIAQNAAALAKSNSDAIAELLMKKHPSGSPQGFDSEGATWTAVISHLFDNYPSTPKSKMQTWAANVGIQQLLQNHHYTKDAADKLLEKYPLASFSQAELDPLVESMGKPSAYSYSVNVPWQVAAYIKQAKDVASLQPLVTALLKYDTIHTAAALGSVVSKFGGLGVSNESLVALLTDKPKGSPLREAILFTHGSALLHPGNEVLAPLIAAQLAGRVLNIPVADLFSRFATAPDSPLFRMALRPFATTLVNSYHGNPSDLRAQLRQHKLYELSDQQAFIAEALALEKTDVDEARLRLAWLLSEPEGVKVDTAAAFKQIFMTSQRSQHGDAAMASVQWLTAEHGKSPLQPLLKDLLLAPTGDAPHLAQNQKVVLQHQLIEVLSSTDPELMAYWPTMLGNSIHINANHALQALQQLAKHPEPTGAAAAAARRNLLKHTTQQVLGSRNDALVGQLQETHVTRADVELTQEQLETHVSSYVANQYYSMKNLTALPLYLRFVLSGPDGALDAAAIEQLLVKVEQSWASYYKLPFIDALLTECPDSLKVKLLQLRKKITG